MAPFHDSRVPDAKTEEVKRREAVRAQLTEITEAYKQAQGRDTHRPQPVKVSHLSGNSLALTCNALVNTLHGAMGIDSPGDIRHVLSRKLYIVEMPSAQELIVAATLVFFLSE